MLRSIIPLLVGALLIAGCTAGNEGAGVAGDTARSVATSAGPAVEPERRAAAGFVAADWTPPTDAEIPNDSVGAAVRRGLALIIDTHDSLPEYAPGRINCTSCHLDAGRNMEAAPLAGAHARFPKYLARTGAVISLADRVNYCFTRSLAGTRLPGDSREMQDILAYIAFVSKGVPVGENTRGADGLIKMDRLAGDTARGAEQFRTTCAVCHGADGQGGAGRIPALWGPRSYSVGASMAREERAASFIWHNMPLGQGRSLTPQQAFDVAAYINARPRPDSPGKQNDWPLGGAPTDVPYATSGHVAYKPPPLLARRNAAGAIVPRPARVRTTASSRSGA